MPNLYMFSFRLPESGCWDLLMKLLDMPYVCNITAYFSFDYVLDCKPCILVVSSNYGKQLSNDGILTLKCNTYPH